MGERKGKFRDRGRVDKKRVSPGVSISQTGSRIFLSGPFCEIRLQDSSLTFSKARQSNQFNPLCFKVIRDYLDMLLLS